MFSNARRFSFKSVRLTGSAINSKVYSFPRIASINFSIPCTNCLSSDSSSLLKPAISVTAAIVFFAEKSFNTFSKTFFVTSLLFSSISL